MDGWTDGRMAGRMDGRMDGRMGGRTWKYMTSRKFALGPADESPPALASRVLVFQYLGVTTRQPDVGLPVNEQVGSQLGTRGLATLETRVNAAWDAWGCRLQVGAHGVAAWDA